METARERRPTRFNEKPSASSEFPSRLTEARRAAHLDGRGAYDLRRDERVVRKTQAFDANDGEAFSLPFEPKRAGRDLTDRRGVSFPEVYSCPYETRRAQLVESFAYASGDEVS